MRTEFTTVKMAELAPIPSARVRIATRVNPGVRNSFLVTCFSSLAIESNSLLLPGVAGRPSLRSAEPVLGCERRASGTAAGVALETVRRVFGRSFEKQ